MVKRSKCFQPTILFKHFTGGLSRNFWSRDPRMIRSLHLLSMESENGLLNRRWILQFFGLQNPIGLEQRLATAEFMVCIQAFFLTTRASFLSVVLVRSRLWMSLGS